MSSKFRNLILILVLGTVGVCAVTGPAQAQSGACSAKKAKKEMVKARKAYREADRVWSATKKYTKLHGSDVGRWVRLARESGWSWSRMPWLMSIMYRESRGDPNAKNPSSTASGLAQFLAFWWDGSDPSIAAIFKKHRLSYPWNPFNARACLEHWDAAVDEVGTSPWSL